MMKRDFNEYFVATQKQYTETLKVLEQVNKELEAGMCTQEQRDNFAQYFDAIRVNYERLAYVRYLLHKPPKFIQKLQEKKLDYLRDKWVQVK